MNLYWYTTGMIFGAKAERCVVRCVASKFMHWWFTAVFHVVCQIISINLAASFLSLWNKTSASLWKKTQTNIHFVLLLDRKDIRDTNRLVFLLCGKEQTLFQCFHDFSCYISKRTNSSCIQIKPGGCAERSRWIQAYLYCMISANKSPFSDLWPLCTRQGIWKWVALFHLLTLVNTRCYRNWFCECEFLGTLVSA